ncbi:hypothetical protein [Membranihabitans maritimus]|uniref:hypothetical protein n=1 Tax=Membranihabitans maritimus TaxID=2904244 RepID=UPI001F3B0136|nr:hypothetical protein [Membranihabitans maritimus]
MANPSKAKKFNTYLQLFNPIEFPFTLHSDAHHDFSKSNKSIHPDLIKDYITPYIGKNEDEYTEYIPCFLLDEQKNYIAVVVWKAGLKEYEYYVLTYNNAGDVIHHQVIGGMKSDGEKVISRIAIIDDEKSIHMVEGELKDQETDYDPLKTKEYSFVLNEEGYLSLEH